MTLCQTKLDMRRHHSVIERRLISFYWFPFIESRFCLLIDYKCFVLNELQVKYLLHISHSKAFFFPRPFVYRKMCIFSGDTIYLLPLNIFYFLYFIPLNQSMSPFWEQFPSSLETYRYCVKQFHYCLPSCIDFPKVQLPYILIFTLINWLWIFIYNHWQKTRYQNDYWIHLQYCRANNWIYVQNGNSSAQIHLYKRSHLYAIVLQMNTLTK